MPAHSQADQGLGPAEREPEKKKNKKKWFSWSSIWGWPCGPTFLCRNKDVFREKGLLKSV